jgi:hypothetical protein
MTSAQKMEDGADVGHGALISARILERRGFLTLRRRAPGRPYAAKLTNAGREALSQDKAKK